MSADTQGLALRRQRLNAEIDAERQDLVAAGQSLARPLRVIHTIERRTEFIRAHPALLLLPLLGLALLIPRRIVRAAVTALTAWRFLKKRPLALPAPTGSFSNH
jgi:hypothetical protein